jgi:intracellular sulfur oxidation DsrE/DsrF family protein
MESAKKYRVVFHLSNNDTYIHHSLIRQIEELISDAEEISIEVVTHGFGIDFLITGNPFVDKIKLFQQLGVTFIACKNTLEVDKIDATRLVTSVTIVPVGILHVIARQAAGWSYIKAGF